MKMNESYPEFLTLSCEKFMKDVVRMTVKEREYTI